MGMNNPYSKLRQITLMVWIPREKIVPISQRVPMVSFDAQTHRLATHVAALVQLTDRESANGLQPKTADKMQETIDMQGQCAYSDHNENQWNTQDKCTWLVRPPLCTYHHWDKYSGNKHLGRCSSALEDKWSRNADSSAHRSFRVVTNNFVNNPNCWTWCFDRSHVLLNKRNCWTTEHKSCNRPKSRQMEIRRLERAGRKRLDRSNWNPDSLHVYGVPSSSTGTRMSAELVVSTRPNGVVALRASAVSRAVWIVCA